VSTKVGTGSSASASFLWSVRLAITSAADASASVGHYFTLTVHVTGIPTTIKATTRPPKGLKLRNLDGDTASLSGTPNRRDLPGDYHVVITATYGRGATATVVTQAFTLNLTD
jgi:hypothetical protein